MTSTRRPSVARLLARRAAEDAKLREALETMKEQRAALDARIREVEAMLGRPSAHAPARPITGDIARCVDCSAFVPIPENAGQRGSECPACGASPFEASWAGARRMAEAG